LATRKFHWIAGRPPFNTVMTVGEGIKNSWSPTVNEPPVPARAGAREARSAGH
jgi:hypothetical protein